MRAETKSKEEEHYTEVMKNSRSLMQGDVMSAALFSLAIMPALELARAELRGIFNCKEIEYFSYIDDVTWILPDNLKGPDPQRTVFEITSKHLQHVGSKIKESKTLTLFPAQSRFQWAEQFERENPDNATRAKTIRETCFIDVLGAPFVTEPQSLTAQQELIVENFIRERMLHGSRGQQHAARLKKLSKEAWLPHISAAFTIIKRSIIPSASYIIRNSPIGIAHTVVEEFDKMVEETVLHLLLLQNQALSPSQRSIISLTNTHGGLGIIKLAPLAADMARAATNGTAKKEGSAGK